MVTALKGRDRLSAKSGLDGGPGDTRCTTSLTSDYRRNTNACCRTAAGAFTTPMVKVFTTKLPSLAVDWTRIEYDLRAA